MLLFPGGHSADRAPHSAERGPLSQSLPEYGHFKYFCVSLGMPALFVGDLPHAHGLMFL